jgi:hypothetical protein
VYYKHVHLDAVREIVDHFSPLIEKYRNTNKSIVEWLDESYNEWLNDRISLKQYTGKVNRVIGAFVFAVVPKDNPAVYHIDGDGTGNFPYETPRWALNIPLYNCDQGEMFWVNGDYETETIVSEHGIPYLNIIWKSEPKIVESVVVDKPTIVKIDVPHKVINHMDSVRMMLTIRFEPDIDWNEHP